MIGITLSEMVELAKRATNRAKSVKSWRLNKPDAAMQSLDIPKGYLIMTAPEANALYRKYKGVDYCNWDDGRKHMYALFSSLPNKNGKVRMSLIMIR